VNDYLLQQTTEAVLVQIVPTGAPGFVHFVTRSVGPVRLSEAEMIRALRSAADELEAAGAETDPTL